MNSLLSSKGLFFTNSFFFKCGFKIHFKHFYQLEYMYKDFVKLNIGVHFPDLRQNQHFIT